MYFLDLSVAFSTLVQTVPKLGEWLDMLEPITRIVSVHESCIDPPLEWTYASLEVLFAPFNFVSVSLPCSIPVMC